MFTNLEHANLAVQFSCSIKLLCTLCDTCTVPVCQRICTYMRVYRLILSIFRRILCKTASIHVYARIYGYSIRILHAYARIYAYSKRIPLYSVCILLQMPQKDQNATGSKSDRRTPQNLAI